MTEPDAPEASAAPLPPEQQAGGPRQELLELALVELRQRRAGLEEEISALERRREQIQREIASSFSGQSDAIARRVKGFQEYLVGALQDLAVAAEQVELVAQPVVVQPSPLDSSPAPADAAASAPPPAAGLFRDDEALIREQLERFLGQPDFYADPWKLRRSLERQGAALLADWFLGQGGRAPSPAAAAAAATP